PGHWRTQRSGDTETLPLRGGWDLKSGFRLRNTAVDRMIRRLIKVGPRWPAISQDGTSVLRQLFLRPV
ncbi:MAG: hypothetical protein ACLQDI_02720, partial [Syntrophobacteraceae bacterium]